GPPGGGAGRHHPGPGGSDRHRAVVPVIVIAVLAALAGIVLGLLSPVTIPITYARYTAVALLAGLDSIFGALKAQTAGTFEARILARTRLSISSAPGGIPVHPCPGGNDWLDSTLAPARSRSSSLRLTSTVS